MSRVLTSLAVLAVIVGCQATTPSTPVDAAPVASASPSASPSTAYHAPRITPEDVFERQQGGESFLVVDVRSAASYQLSHIEGAVNHPWGSIQQADPGFPRDKFILLYCT